MLTLRPTQAKGLSPQSNARHIVGVLAVLSFGAPSCNPLPPPAPPSQLRTERSLTATELRADLLRLGKLDASDNQSFRNLAQLSAKDGCAEADSVRLLDLKDVGDFRWCDHALAPSQCYRIRNNCISLDSSVFCDPALTAPLVGLTMLTYYNALTKAVGQQATTITPDMLEIQNDILMDAVREHAPQERISVSNSAAILYFARAVLRCNQALKRGIAMAQSSICCSMTAFAALGDASGLALIIGHEFAHAEGRLCPGVAGANVIAARTAQELDRYQALTCLKPSPSEVAADLRGIELAVALIRGHLPGDGFSYPEMVPSDCDEGESGADCAASYAGRKLLFEHSDQLALATLVHSAENAMLIAWSTNPERTLAREPPNERENERLKYWFDLGVTQGMGETDFGHLAQAYRFARIAEAVSYQDFAAEMSEGSSRLGLRFAAMIVGELSGIRAKHCKIPLDAAKDFVSDELRFILPKADVSWFMSEDR